MSLAFKGRHFAPDIILLCMGWYCRYALPDPPPSKWSALKYGFESLKEDGHGKTP